MTTLKQTVSLLFPVLMLCFVHGVNGLCVYITELDAGVWCIVAGVFLLPFNVAFLAALCVLKCRYSTELICE